MGIDERVKLQIDGDRVTSREGGIDPCTLPEGVRQLLAEIASQRERYDHILGACIDNPVSSRVCERGTKCCDVRHPTANEITRLTQERDALSARVENLKFDMNLVGAQLGISSREEIEPAVRKLLTEIDRLSAAAARQEPST